MKNINLKVKKRDGSIVSFCDDRILKAISMAYEGFYKKTNSAFCLKAHKAIIEKINKKNQDILSVKDIQKLVEDSIMELDADVARAYIEYRHDKDTKRTSHGRLISDITSLLDKSNTDLLNENANKDGKVIPTQRDLLAGITAKHYAKEHMLPKNVVDSHESGEIHFHDLDYSPFFPMFNCMLVDLKGMLTNGFKMDNAEIESPKSINTAAEITAQIIAQVASHTYGGTTINRIDEILSPYVTMSFEKNKKIITDIINSLSCSDSDIDNVVYKKAMDMTEKNCYDAFQSLEYEINTIRTSNGQTPFVTLGFGLETSWEGRLIQKSILKNRIAGLGKNKKTPVFPKLVFSIKDGINHKKGDINYDIKQLALECASKRMYPDILNYEKVVEVTGSFKAPMGCRSFLGVYHDENGNEVHDGRNNLGVVTINLPRVAIEANGDEFEFHKILDKRLAIAKDALIARIDRLRGVKARVAPILYMEGACGKRLSPDDEIFQLFENGRASVSLGYIGIHETIISLFGKHIYDDNLLREKGISIVKKLKDAVDKWKKETGFGFSLYATPSENLCYRFCKLDSKKFGIIEGVNDKGYYTNSFHLDVEKKVNAYDKIDFESGYPEISSGGFIVYGEFPNMQHNIEALENIWDYSYSRVPYYGTNTPIDECYECGYKGEFDCTSKGFECPKCGNHEPSRVSVIRRVCGYLGSPDSRPFNSGKQEEVKRRVKHM